MRRKRFQLVFDRPDILADALYNALGEAGLNRMATVKPWAACSVKERARFETAARNLIVRLARKTQRTNRSFIQKQVYFGEDQIVNLRALSDMTGVPVAEYIRQGLDLVLQERAEKP